MAGLAVMGWRAFVASLVIALGASGAHAQNRQQEAKLAYLRDMPTPEQVVAAFSGGPTPAQTMGRQCAALSMLLRGRIFPDMSFTGPGVELAERYRAAAAAIERQYSATIKPLDDVENRREWTRMCENRRSGRNPLSGQEESGWPALETPVTMEELMPLFKPSVREALDRVAVENRQLAAAQKTRNENMVKQAEAARAQGLRDQMFGVIMMVGSLVAVAVIVLMLVWIARATARIGAKPGKQTGEVLINGKPYQIRHFGGRLLEGRKERETIWHEERSNDPGQPARRWSTTVIHDRLRVEDTQGKTHTLHLKDWDLGYKDGDTLQFYRLVKDGKTDEEFAVIANRSSGGTWSDHNVLARKAAPINGLLAIVLVVFAGLCTLGIGWLVGGLWIWYSSRRMAKVEGEVEKWVAACEPLPAVPQFVSPAA
ncbi:hypothetical protein ACO2Q9_15880 [Variovorax sp. VNK109]|uniref:hypothetical protein n=1 Tax=Variovorax sp. VNK109 TaxID=3400919 RepID=UPI003BFAA96C